MAVCNADQHLLSHGPWSWIFCAKVASDWSVVWFIVIQIFRLFLAGTDQPSWYKEMAGEYSFLQSIWFEDVQEWRCTSLVTRHLLTVTTNSVLLLHFFFVAIFGEFLRRMLCLQCCSSFPSAFVHQYLIHVVNYLASMVIMYSKPSYQVVVASCDKCWLSPFVCCLLSWVCEGLSDISWSCMCVDVCMKEVWMNEWASVNINVTSLNRAS